MFWVDRTGARHAKQARCALHLVSHASQYVCEHGFTMWSMSDSRQMVHRFFELTPSFFFILSMWCRTDEVCPSSSEIRPRHFSCRVRY